MATNFYYSNNTYFENQWTSTVIMSDYDIIDENITMIPVKCFDTNTWGTDIIINFDVVNSDEY